MTEKRPDKPERPEKTSYGDCESCVYFFSDEEGEGCALNLDEDEYIAFALRAFPTSFCPYYRDGDEYRTVRKQI